MDDAEAQRSVNLCRPRQWSRFLTVVPTAAGGYNRVLPSTPRGTASCEAFGGIRCCRVL